MYKTLHSGDICYVAVVAHPCLCLLGTGGAELLPLPVAAPDGVDVHLHIVPCQLSFAVSQKRPHKVTFHLKLLHM